MDSYTRPAVYLAKISDCREGTRVSRCWKGGYLPRYDRGWGFVPTPRGAREGGTKAYHRRSLKKVRRG